MYLKSFADDVLILPTKTKPKKLYMNGSDGNRYAQATVLGYYEIPSSLWLDIECFKSPRQ